jgi:hypothetical protein
MQEQELAVELSTDVRMIISLADLIISTKKVFCFLLKLKAAISEKNILL